MTKTTESYKAFLFLSNFLKVLVLRHTVRRRRIKRYRVAEPKQRTEKESLSSSVQVTKAILNYLCTVNIVLDV